MRIINGRLGDDAGVGRFTCVKGNGHSVVDYVLCKSDMFFLVNSFDVDEPNILSDHCVVSFSLDTSANIREAVRDDGLDLQYIYSWDNNKKKKQEYLDALNSHTVSEGISSIKIN